MEKEAAEADVGAKGLIFLPYLLGERAPIWNDDARGVFFGLERMHTRKDMTRAVFESAGFIDMDMKNAIEETGIKIKQVRLSGGLARLKIAGWLRVEYAKCVISTTTIYRAIYSGWLNTPKFSTSSDIKKLRHRVKCMRRQSTEVKLGKI